MENNKESKPSFWSTLPGILTAMSAIIGAFAGLITALYGAGLIGYKNTQPSNPPPISSPTIEPQQININKPEQTISVEASRNFFIGRWQVEQAYGEVSGGTVVDYQDDGTFAGSTVVFVGGQGQKQRVAGQWYIKKLSKNTFRLNLQFDNQSTWTGTFKIIDQDHILNIDENYIAVRSK